MNLKNLLSKVTLLLTLLLFVGGSALAQSLYVNQTDGDDNIGTGTQGNPFRTIKTAINAVPAAGGYTINIATGTYDAATIGEAAPVNINKPNVTLVAFQNPHTSVNVVSITGGITVAPGSGKYVNLGRSADGSLGFNLGSSANALTLSSGSLQITSANVTIAAGGTLTVTDGTVDNTPTTTQLNVVYNGANDRTAGAELPASFTTSTTSAGSTCGITFASAITVTINKAISFTETGAAPIADYPMITATAVGGSANFTQSVTWTFNKSGNTFADQSVITNNGAGSLSFTNVILTQSNTGTGDGVTNSYKNNSTGSLTISANSYTSSKTTVNVSNNNAGGRLILGGGGATKFNGSLVNVGVGATGYLSLAGNVEFNGSTLTNVGALIKLNSYTLTISNTCALDNTSGAIVSVSAGTSGGGTILATKKVTITSTAAGSNLPNLSATGSGAFVFSAGALSPVTVDGSITLNSTAIPTFNDGGADIKVSGNFTRQTADPTDIVMTGRLTFNGTPQQTFNPGGSMVAKEIKVDKSGAGVGELTLGASLMVTGDFNIANGRVNLSDYNIRLTGGNATFTNGGSYYSSTGNGYLIIEGFTKTLAGLGTYGNIDVRCGSGNSATLAAATRKFSGTLILRSGTLITGTLQFTTTNVPVCKIMRSVIAADGAGITSAVDVSTNGVYYDLVYFGDNGIANVLPVSSEWNIGAATYGMRDVSISSSTTAGTTVTTAAGTKISGALTVAAGQTLSLGAALESTGSVTHSIRGTVTGGFAFTVSGAAVVINGFTATGDAAAFGAGTDLTIDPSLNNATVTVNGIVKFGGNVNVVPTGGNGATGVTANITMNSTNSTLTGDLVVGHATAAPTVTFNMAGTTVNSHVGGIVVNSGNVTYTRVPDTDNTVGTSIAVNNAGVLVLGSSVVVTTTTSIAADASIIQNKNDLTINGNFSGPGALTQTTGRLIVNNNLSITPAVATYSLVNLRIQNGKTLTLVGNPLTVSGLLDQYKGSIADGGNDIIVTGNYYYFTGSSSGAGTYGGTGALTLKGATTTVKAGGAITIPNIIVNSTGTVTFISDKETASTPAYRIFTTTTFTQTAGNVVTGGNDIIVTGGASAFARGASAGSWSQGKGLLEFNGAALTFDPGTDFAIDNLYVKNNGTGNVGSNSFTVNKSLKLDVPFTASNSASTGKLTLGNGATVERTNNAAKLTYAPVFGTSVNLIYSGTGVITADVEVPTTNIINNLTVTADDGSLVPVGFTLNAPLTINGTLTLKTKVNNSTTNSITMAPNSWLELQSDGTNVLVKALKGTGNYGIIYNGAANTTTMELGTQTTTSGITSYDKAVGAITVGAGSAPVSLDANLVTTGTFTFDGGSFDILGHDLSIQGDVVETDNAAGFFDNSSGTAAKVSLSGANNTLLSLIQNETIINSDVHFAIDKDNAFNTVTLSGGNLVFTNANVNLYLTNGVLVTGSKMVVLRQEKNALNKPDQGFVRVSGHISGNVKKFLDPYVGAAPNYMDSQIALTRVEFPVGNVSATAADYRPFSLQFNTLPTSAVNITVSEVEATPGGSNGFPLSVDGLNITNYPNFYWLVKSDLTLQPQVKYDIEAQAAGYSEYQADGIQNVRFVRRFDNNLSNPWIVQGGLGYDNSTDGTTPVVIVRSAQGAISSQGARFTYSQLNKAPVLSAPADVVVNEGVKTTVTWTATDSDFGQTVSWVGVTWATTTPAVVPTNATFADGVLTWTPTSTQAGVYTVTVTVTDGVATKTDAVQITVNDMPLGPKWTGTGTLVPTTPQSATQAKLLTLNYLAVDGDALPITYSVASVPAPSVAPAISALGVLTFTPGFADIGKSFTFTVTATSHQSTTPIAVAATPTVVNVVADPSRKGDCAIPFDSKANATDASAILQFLVNKTTFTDEQKYYGKVTATPAAPPAVNVLNPLDASFILSYGLNGTWPLSKAVAATGTVEFGKVAAEKGVYSLPVTLAKAAGVLSLYSEIQLGNQVEFKAVSTNLPEGWLVASNFENGVLRIAAAGTTPLTDGNVANISISLKNAEASANVQGSVVLNDNSAQTLNAVKIKEIPTEFSLSQNYPNPFNPTTSIKYAIPQDAKVSLVVYNILGQVVKTLVDNEQESGYYTIRWDGTNDFGSKVTSGIYIYRITAGNYTSTVKMNLLK